MITETFQRELEQTLYLHRVLPLHREYSLEATFPRKQVLDARCLWGTDEKTACCHHGLGTLEESMVDGMPVLRVSCPNRADHWPEGHEDGDYCNFGASDLVFPLPREDWRPFNRLHFRVFPHANGARLLHLRLSLVSEGEIPVPDEYLREGAHVVDLAPDAWNDCYWEFHAMGRDAVVQLTFSVTANGRDVSMGDSLSFDFAEIALEQVRDPEVEHGWHCASGQITYSTVGYFPQGSKTAVANVDADIFSLVDAETGAVVYTAPVETVHNERGTFQVLDFSPVETPGRYRLCAGPSQTEPFLIAAGLTEESTWRAVNFLFGERCGCAVPGRHGSCHFDLIAEHNGLKMIYAGGWHDAGDLSQQTVQSAEVVHALLENAARCLNPALQIRLREEAEYGLDFVLRTRFGDGYRATSAGVTRYTNNLVGDLDDVPVRVHNQAFENFLFAGVEACAAVAFAEADPGLACGSLQAAREDFAFAQQRFAQTGVEHTQPYEHTYNCGLSSYYAAIVWAASSLYRACGEAYYADTACQWADCLLACQETGTAGLPFTGFFYRDESHQAIVHFNHQSREQLFAQALTTLCETQPNAAKRHVWQAAMRRYGDYLLAIAPYTAPYGMLPAGVHRLDEPENEALFPYLHLLCNHAEQKENYAAQLAAGIPVGENHVVRNFPIWFSFRGNNAVLLAMGKSASLLGHALQDDRLLQLGREQLYWMWGKNPFGQSMVYGAGNRYCSQYAALCGELSGEMPVGIETLENEDLPYWPQNNNATYKEVWTSAVSRWLWVAADYQS